MLTVWDRAQFQRDGRVSDSFRVCHGANSSHHLDLHELFYPLVPIPLPPQISPTASLKLVSM